MTNRNDDALWRHGVQVAPLPPEPEPLRCACECNGMGKDCHRKLTYNGHRLTLYNGDVRVGSIELSADDQRRLARAMLERWAPDAWETEVDG